MRSFLGESEMPSSTEISLFLSVLDATDVARKGGFGDDKNRNKKTKNKRKTPVILICGFFTLFRTVPAIFDLQKCCIVLFSQLKEIWPFIAEILDFGI